jgi:cell division protein FtsB
VCSRQKKRQDEVTILMRSKSKNLSVSSLVYFATTFSLAAYFTFAAVQGDQGLFRRVQIQAQEQDLTVQLAALKSELAEMENKTRRLSDSYLDLDLLDEQARKVLGYARGDEIVIR